MVTLNTARYFRLKRLGGAIAPDQILTKCRILGAPVRQNTVVADVNNNVLKIAVVERHGGTGNIGLGMVQGFGLKEGAPASSVAHDSHNIICVGCTDEDMHCAVKDVECMKGGLTARIGHE